MDISELESQLSLLVLENSQLNNKSQELASANEELRKLLESKDQQIGD